MLLTLVGVIYGLFFVERVLFSFLLTETLSTFMGISILGGIIWRRANRWGAASSLVVSLATNFLIYSMRQERLDHWDPAVFLTALSTGTLALIVVSYATKPEPESQLNSFSARLQISSDYDKERVGARSIRETGDDPAIQKSAEAGQQLLLVNLLNLNRGSMGVGFLKAYSKDLSGLAFGSLLVVLLIVLTWWLARL